MGLSMDVLGFRLVLVQQQEVDRCAGGFHIWVVKSISQQTRSFTRHGRALNTSPSTNPLVSSVSLANAASPFAHQIYA